MTFERACALADVPEDEALRRRRSAAQDVAVARNGDEVFAVEDECSHAAVALSEGEVDDVHASSAGCTARASTCAPASPPGLPATEPVATFPVEVDEPTAPTSTSTSPPP